MCSYTMSPAKASSRPAESTEADTVPIGLGSRAGVDMTVASWTSVWGRCGGTTQIYRGLTGRATGVTTVDRGSVSLVDGAPGWAGVGVRAFSDRRGYWRASGRVKGLPAGSAVRPPLTRPGACRQWRAREDGRLGEGNMVVRRVLMENGGCFDGGVRR